MLHDKFLWIQRLGKVPDGRQPKDRKIRVLRLYLPNTREEGSWEASESIIQQEYLMRMMKDGAELVAEGITFDYKNYSRRRFLRAVYAYKRKTDGAVPRPAHSPQLA